MISKYISIVPISRRKTSSYTTSLSVSWILFIIIYYMKYWQWTKYKKVQSEVNNFIKSNLI